jgi:hypothetical protein
MDGLAVPLLFAVIGTAVAAGPTRGMPPLAVVQAQLEALQAGDCARCFAHASPSNRAATGPYDRFERMIRLTPAYSPLICCTSYEVTSSLMVAEDRWRCRVRVRPAGSSSAPFAIASPAFLNYDWSLSLQDEGAGEEAGCWMVDGVAPDRSPLE